MQSLLLLLLLLLPLPLLLLRLCGAHSRVVAAAAAAAVISPPLPTSRVYRAAQIPGSRAGQVFEASASHGCMAAKASAAAAKGGGDGDAPMETWAHSPEALSVERGTVSGPVVQ